MGVREPKTGVNDVLSSGIEIGEEDQAEIGGPQSAILTERKLQKTQLWTCKITKIQLSKAVRLKIQRFFAFFLSPPEFQY
jgi:hypothetical protein